VVHFHLPPFHTFRNFFTAHCCHSRWSLIAPLVPV